MPWPVAQDYNEAVQEPRLCFADDELRAGQVITNALGLPVPCSGNFADVYAIVSGQRKWAVKCFTREVHGLRERYGHISTYLTRVQLPFMVDFGFLEQGIRIDGQWYPVVKMPWIEGQTLNTFLKEQASSPGALNTLAQIWRKMDDRLRGEKMAHGDLQHGNVLLVRGRQASSLAVRLVDYDGMCVPALERIKSAEVGHPNYQHPERLQEGGYGRDMDRFAQLAIYTALRAVATGGRALWERFDNGDNLLFTQADFAAPGESTLFQELARSPNAEVNRLAFALAEVARSPLSAVPTLDDVVGPTPVTAVQTGPSSGTRLTAPAAPPPVPATAPAAGSLFADLSGERPGPTGRRLRKGKGGSKLALVLGAVAAVVAIVGVGLYFAFREPKPPHSSVAHLPTTRSGKSTSPEKPPASTAPAPDHLPIAAIPSVEGAAVAGRASIPDPDGQQLAFRDAKLRAGDEIARGDPAGLRVVARKLLDMARNAPAGPAWRFGTLVVSRDVAALGGDVAMALESATILGDEYAVDAVQVKTRALELAAERAAGADVQQAVAENALGVVEDAITADRFDAAAALLALAEKAADKLNNKTLQKQVAERTKALEPQRQVFTRARAAIAKLEKDPEGQEANRIAGIWYACWKDDWDRGLPLLAKGDETEWKEAAAAELARPGSAAEKKDIADRWWTLAAGLSGRVAAALRGHAAGWYQDALPELKGAEKTEAQSRLEEVGDEVKKVVDLLGLIDVERAPSIGLWTREGKALITPKIANARIQIPYLPPEEYRIAMRVERMEMQDCLNVWLVVHGHQCKMVIDGWPRPAGAQSGFEWIDGRSVPQNETTRPGVFLKQGVPADILITVSKEGVTTQVDGKTIITYKGSPERLSISPTEVLPTPNTLRIGCWEAVHRITKMELTPLSGRGRKIPYPPAPEPVKDGVYLSDLTPESSWVGYPRLGTNGDLGYGGSDGDNRIRSNWVWYRKGISPHPGPRNKPSTVVYRLDGKYRSFSTVAALNDDAPRTMTPLLFSVLVDGREKWKSPPLQEKGGTARCDIDVRGARRLELRISIADSRFAHAVWLDPVLRR
jgi:hypothetical protein